MFADPAVPLSLTFSEPVRIGGCVGDGYCSVRLAPQNSALGHYTMDNSLDSSTGEIAVAGMTAVLTPRLFLKPNANYTVEWDDGVFEGIQSGEVLKKGVGGGGTTAASSRASSRCSTVFEGIHCSTVHATELNRRSNCDSARLRGQCCIYPPPSRTGSRPARP